MPADLAEFALAKLKVTAAVTDLLLDGQAGIFEPGQLTPQYLAEAEQRRRDAQTPTKLLALLIQDAGDEAATELQHTQSVSVYLYDRGKGRSNIKTVRKQVYLALHGECTPLDDPFVGRTAAQLHFKRREGHQHDYVLVVDYEKIVFMANLIVEHG